MKVGNKKAKMKLNIRLLMALLFLYCFSVQAEQYQSHELLTSKGQSKYEVKSIMELEAELNKLTDAYAKDSTARYLARHYAQQRDQASVQKAIVFYRQSLSGSGLSVYAKQVTALELMALLYNNEMHQAFLDTAKQYESYGGKPKSDLLIQMALCHYQLQHKKDALNLAVIIFNKQNSQEFQLSLDELNQLLYLFYNSADYLHSAQVQQFIIELDSYNAKQWLRLGKLHLKNKQANKAADTLFLATQKGLLVEQADIILMCDLMLSSGNPFVAARLMQQLMDMFNVDHTIENYDRLFRYWYTAHELEAAAATLKKSLYLNKDSVRYLDLAQLYYQLQDWPAMNTTIINLCDDPLQGKFVSRASLLLGISELKLGNKRGAIEAFVDATLIGGEVKQAQAYLEYLKVEKSNPTMRRARFNGPCMPIH